MLLSDEWKDERIWPRGDIGITKHKKDTAKIRSLKLSSNSSQKWWLHNLLYFCEKTQRLHTNCLMLLKMCSELKIINWWVNINWATIFLEFFESDTDCSANLERWCDFFLKFPLIALIWFAPYFWYCSDKHRNWTLL